MVRYTLVALLLWLAFPALAQRKNKTADVQDRDKPFYAYPTESTLRKKSRNPSQSGDNGYYVEKPMADERVDENDRTFDYSKPPYFGHRRPVIRRSPKHQRLCRVCGIKH